MKVANIMQQPIVTVRATARIADAAAKMRDWNVGILTVMDQDQLVGVITDRDIVVRGVVNGETAHSALVREIMSDEVLICLDKQSIEDAAAIMCDFQVRRLPVFNSADKVVGLLSIDEIAEHYSEHLAGETLGEIVERRNTPHLLDWLLSAER